MAILNALAYTISASKLVENRPLGYGLCREILQMHMKSIYRNLSSGSNAMIHCTLRLLAAMANFSPAINKLVFETWDFTLKAASKFVRMRRSKDDSSFEDDPYTFTFVFLF
jgi:hypothetical protein